MKITMENNAEIKEIRKAMRAAKKADELVTILIKGWGQITAGCGIDYAVGPLPEEDDSDPMTDYSAWTYGCQESLVLNWIKQARR